MHRQRPDPPSTAAPTELDTSAAVLPTECRDELVELLTDQDAEAPRHLVDEGMGNNTLRALTPDLAYLQAWSLASTSDTLPYSAPEALLRRFVAHHLWNQERAGRTLFAACR